MAKEKRKILMLAPLPPPVHGSTLMTRYIKESGLVNEAVDMDWVNLSTSRRMDEIGKSTPVKYLRFAAAFFKTAFKLMTRRYHSAYIAIACRGVGFLKDAPLALLCKIFRVPLIIHQHNRGMADYVDRPIYRNLFPRVYRNARVVLLSDRLYPDISRVVDHSQVEICPNGIPDEAPQVSVDVAKGSGSVVNLLFLGNLMVDKGVFVLLDALRILNEGGYDFRCDMVGGETEELSAAALNDEIRARGLTEKVAYKGKKYGKEKAEAFANADIFVFPTDYDCFPLVILEAMQHGLAVVTTDVGGNPDIITSGEEGLIVRPNDPVGLAENLKTLIDNPGLIAGFGLKARKKFSSSFSLRNFEENMVRILSSN